MVRKKLVSIIAGGALVLVSVLGAATYQVVAAQGAVAQVAATATPAASAPAQTAPGRGMGARYSDTDLAAALNITADQLKAAEQTATTEAIKQAVAAGLITQAQADQYTQNSSNGQPNGGGMPWLKNSPINYDDLLAKALGITTDQLKATYLKAYETNLAQAVTNGTMTQDQADAAKASYALQNSTDYQNALKTAYATAVKQAVTSGLITQAQADEALKNNNGLGMIGAGGAGRPGGPNNPGSTSTSTSSTKTDFITLLAKALGISTDQFKAAYQQATAASLDQAVTDGTMTQSQADAAKASNALTNSSDFQAAMKAANEAAVKQAVTSGLITQAQADVILKNATTFVVPGAGGAGLGMPGMGGPGGPDSGFGGRGGHGGPGGNPPANSGSSNSTGTTNP